MKSILTGTDAANLLAVLDTKYVSEKWQKALGVDLGDTFRSLSTIEYWQCPITSFCWYTPSKAAGGSELYAQLEGFDWYYMKDKWEFSVALELLEKKSAVLEVGVGEGHFLQAARKKGHLAQGIELNPKGAARARAMGFDIYELMLDELRGKIDKHFDAICAFQVLEHVPDPRYFLEGMIGMLRPGGKIILSVPNAEVMRKIDPHNQDLLNQPPHHMGHWDENVFRALESFLPVKVRTVQREPFATYHVAWMINCYLRTAIPFLRTSFGGRVSRILVNRYSTLPLQWLVLAGLKRYIPGHTILVELEYLNR